MVQDGRAQEALSTARSPLEYFRANRSRRYEQTALSVMARAYEGLGEYAQARAMAEQSLQRALELKDEAAAGIALENLAGPSNALGALPDALGYRSRTLELHRRQKDIATLAYDLPNTADLLIRLGRHDEAARLLDEFEAGIKNGIDAFKQRERRAPLLRALSAAVRHQFDELSPHAQELLPAGDVKPDSTSQLAAQLIVYADAARGRTAGVPRDAAPAGSASSSGARELRYWDLAGGWRLKMDARP